MNVITHTFVELKCLTETRIQILCDQRFHFVEMGCQMVQLFSAHIVGPTMFVSLTLTLLKKFLRLSTVLKTDICRIFLFSDSYQIIVCSPVATTKSLFLTYGKPENFCTLESSLKVDCLQSEQSDCSDWSRNTTKDFINYQVTQRKVLLFDKA